MAKPKDIFNLEKALGLVLREIKQGDIKDYDNNHYQLDEKGAVVGLNLFGNKLTDISSLKALTSLRELDVSFNKLTDISSLKALTSLTSLNVGINKVTDIVPLSALTSLTQLDVSFNQVTDIVSLSKLPSLTQLHLGGNQLTDISSLSALISLIELNVSSNQLTDISSLSALTSLMELNVSSNQLTDIQTFEKIVGIKTLKQLYADDNPFAASHNLVLKTNFNHLGPIRVALWKIKEAEEANAIDGYLPVKVLMLGNHGSGKSSLVHYLNKSNLKTTHDITHILNIVRYKEQENGLSKALFYDFGGQDFYHGLYQAFLSHRALTMVLWQKEKDKNEKDVDSHKDKRPIRNFNVPYWLGLLKRNNIKEQVFVIRTHKTKGDVIQSYANADVKEEFFLDLEKEETLEITNIVKKSSLTHFQNVFDVFITENQKQQDINKPNKAKGKLSKKFYDFLLKISKEAQSTKDQCVNLSTIRKWYVGIDKSRFDVEIDQLVLSGMILKYKDVVWLNPQALVEKVHKIFSADAIGKGDMEESEFKEKLSIDPNLLGLLEYNRVIFKHGYGEKNGKPITEYIIPNYLPLIESSGIDYDLMVFGMDNPLFILKYQDFMPFGLINHLICHFGRNPDRKKFWRDQLVFTISENDSDCKLLHQAKILIKLNFDDLKIEVYAYFKDRDHSSFKDQLMEYIFYSILSFDSPSFMPFTYAEYKDSRQNFYIVINSFYNKVTGEKRFTILDCPVEDGMERSSIYLNDMIFISLNNTTYVKYTELLENGGKTFIQSYHEDFNIYREQAAYPYQPFTPNKIEKMKKVFISYSNQDHHYKETLLKHLKPLKQFQLIKPWSCEEMTTGNWHNQIQKELSEADVVVFMMSIDFITSDYILREEVFKTFEDIKNNKNKQVLCVLVKNFSWQNFANFKNLTQLSDADFQNLKDANTMVELSSNQFIPYYIENKGEPNAKRYLKPINKWEYEEDAYVEVINQLVKVLS